MANLNFNYSVMGGGKTSALLQLKYNYEQKGLRTLLIKPSIDTKGTTEIVSRIGLHCQVDILLDKNDIIMERVGTFKPAVVLVDEAQFLTPKQVDELYLMSKFYNVPVECYGLRTDFKMEGFGGSTRLLQIADSLNELETICSCGEKATQNLRKLQGKEVFEGEQVMIDEVNVVEYEGVCGKCYLKSRYGRRD